MVGRARTGGLAGALSLAGGVAGVYGVIAGLSIALCPPHTPPAAGNCIGPDLLPWYWFIPAFAFAGAGFAVLTIGLVLYRRAKIR